MAKMSGNMRRRSLLKRREMRRQLGQLKIENELKLFEKRCEKELNALSMIFDFESLERQKFELALKKFDIKENHYALREVNHAYTQKLFQVKSGEYKNQKWAKDFTGSEEELLTLLRENYLQDLERVREERRAFILKQQEVLNKALKEAPSNEEMQNAEAAFEEKKESFSQDYEDLHQNLVLQERRKFDDFSAGIEQKLLKLIQRHKGYNAGLPTLPQDVSLRIENLCMYFGGLRAVDGLTFEVKKGEIFGLIGPNGAGKTTVFNCITQFYKATKGNLYFSTYGNVAVDLRSQSIHDIVLSGIARTFQNVEVIKEVSVLENMLIAATRQYNSGLFGHMFHSTLLKREEQLIKQKAEEVLEFMGLSAYKNWLAWGLPYGILKRIEIARTLMCSPSLIIMDEPAAGLNDTETKELAKLIKEIRVKYNCAIFLVEHDMGLVMDICDRVCAISFGKMLAIGTPKEIQKDKKVQEAYLGVEE